MLGPVLGSMLGAWILYAGWRWIFWVLTIAIAINTVGITFGMRETYSPYVHSLSFVSLIAVVHLMDPILLCWLQDHPKEIGKTPAPPRSEDLLGSDPGRARRSKDQGRLREDLRKAPEAVVDEPGGDCV